MDRTGPDGMTEEQTRRVANVDLIGHNPAYHAMRHRARRQVADWERDDHLAAQQTGDE